MKKSIILFLAAVAVVVLGNWGGTLITKNAEFGPPVLGPTTHVAEFGPPVMGTYGTTI